MLADLATRSGFTRESLDRDGIVCLGGAVSTDWLTAARADVSRFLEAHGPGDHDLINPEQWRCPTINAFAEDSRVERFLDSLVPATVTAEYGGYNTRVLRILDGTGGVDSRPHVWHYDGSAVTMVIPIIVPEDATGQLAVFPDSRPHRSSAAFSAFEQVLAHNWLYNKWILRRFQKTPSAYAVPLVPGDAYLFRGYRSLHGTLPWPAGSLRVTLVLQYGHPYGRETGLLRKARAARNRWRRIRRQTPLSAYPNT